MMHRGYVPNATHFDLYIRSAHCSHGPAKVPIVLERTRYRAGRLVACLILTAAASGHARLASGNLLTAYDGTYVGGMHLRSSVITLYLDSNL